MGTKWKIWILSFHWYPMVYCRSSGFATTASQSQAIFQNVQKCWKWAYLASGEIPIFRTLRFMILLLFFKRAYDWQWLVHSITLSPDSIVSNNGCLMQLSPASEAFCIVKAGNKTRRFHNPIPWHEWQKDSLIQRYGKTRRKPPQAIVKDNISWVELKSVEKNRRKIFTKVIFFSLPIIANKTLEKWFYYVSN